MSLKYVSEYYSYKTKLPGAVVVAADPSTPLENQIHAHVMAGNQAFYAGKYAAALNSYLAAWSLLPKIYYPSWNDMVGRVKPTALLKVEMGAQLAAASAQLLKYREVLPKDAVVSPVVDPPRELVELNAPYLGEGASFSEAYRLGLTYLQTGEYEAAGVRAQEALKLAEKDPEAAADAWSLLGAIGLAQGKYSETREYMAEAQRFYTAAGRLDGAAAAQHNSAVALTRSGRAEEAGAIFAAVSTSVPRGLGWSVTHSLNPGISAVSRGFGEAGLPVMLRDAEGTWMQLSTPVQAQARKTARVLTSAGAVQLKLDDGVQELQAKLLEPRIKEKSLEALTIHDSQLNQFIAYLTHVGGFILPVALGDTYAALGEHASAVEFYFKARDYAYLNQEIERPMLWRKIARLHINQGNRLYRDHDMAGARALFERILVLLPDGSFELTGELYSGGFASYATEHLAYFKSANRAQFTSIEYGRRALLLQALNGATQLNSNINYLGFPDDIVPIHSWRYLQNLARYFANQATQSERAYISFKQSSESEEFTRLQLEQAVDAQRSASDVESLRVKAAREQLDAAMQAWNQAQVRLTNAQNQRNQLASMAQQLAALDEIIAFTNATGLSTDIIIDKGWASTLGITPDTYDPKVLIQLLTRARSGLSQEYELANLDRQIKDLTAALFVANAQIEVAQAMVSVALGQQELAQLKVEQAQAQLDYYNAKEFTPELWDNLAQAQRELSQRYVDWATSAAFLMQRAFEYDYDTQVNRIRSDYARSELNGLLAGEFLLADIDAFSFDRILETQKELPLKVTISLADRYPSQFRDFQQTGRIDFEVLLQDVDQLHPGTCVRKLKKVEVVVEGLVGPGGIHGTLSNAGISHDRGRTGARKTRVQRPETLMLSQYDLRRDGFVFTNEEEVLAPFENAGPAGGWVLEFPPQSNDVDFKAITNVHLVLYFNAYYSEATAAQVKAELAATALYQGSVGLSLRHQYPDEFFAFRDSGAVTFSLDNAYLPHHHSNARIRDVYLVVQTAQGVSNTGLVVRVVGTQGGPTLQQTTDSQGMINTGSGAEPLNGLRQLAVQGTWTVAIDQAANAAAFAAGFSWDKVANVFLFVDYDYSPRGLLTAGDDFVSNSLASFDVVDDPQALTSAPSAWSWDGPNQRLVQTSGIHHPPGAANLNTQPAKPGTYLVRKVDAQWPALADFALRCQLSTGSSNGIGVVFRYQDANNFYFFLMDAQRKYRRIGKKVNGVFKELQTAAVDTTQGFTLNQDYSLSIAVSGKVLKAYLDGKEILSGEDASLPAAGRVGFYSWGNTSARFDKLSLVKI